MLQHNIKRKLQRSKPLRETSTLKDKLNTINYIFTYPKDLLPNRNRRHLPRL